MQKKDKVIAIDFDGTIATLSFPQVGELVPMAREVINTWYDVGHTILIHTCRTGRRQGYAEDFLEEYNIKYHWINTNAPEVVTTYRTDTRKLSADLYIDDKQLGGLPMVTHTFKTTGSTLEVPNWSKIKEIAKKHGI